jgi:hypothetical protein
MKAGPPWSETEISFIRENWRQRDDAELAVELDRPVSGVAHVRLSLGLKRPRGRGASRKFSGKDT